MKKLKPVLVIVGTLLIGFVLGFFVSGYITQHKIKTYMQCANKDGFTNMIYERINASQELKQKIDPILQKYSEKSTECLNRHKAIIDSLHIELEPYLSSEQNQKLQNCMGCKACKGESCGNKKKCLQME